MAITLSSTARDLVRSTFFGKDFDTYRDEIITAINDIFGAEVASNIVASEQGVMLIEAVAFALSTLSWYGDRQADDTNLVDARLRVAAVTIARQLGYKAGAAVPAVVDARIQLTTVPPVQLIIPKGQRAAGPEGLIFETTADVVFDAGQVGSGLPDGMIVQGLSIDPATPATIYAATSTGVFKSIDSGTTWATANAGLTNLNITEIAINPATPTTLYAATNGGGIFKSTNSATSWAPVNAGLTELEVLSIAIDPLTPATVYAGTNRGGAFKTIDSAGTWFAINDSLEDRIVQSIAIDPVTPSIIYLGTFSLGVFKTVNGGAAWAQSSVGLGTLDVADVVVDPVTPTTLYAGTNGGGVFKSIDSGATWVVSNVGLTSTNASALAIDPVTPTTIYLSTDNSGIFKTVDAAATWAIASTGLTNTQTGTIAVDPATPANVYTGTSGGGIFKSTNSAATWEAVNVGIDDPIRTVTLREGITLEEVFKSNGQPNQSFEIATIPEGRTIAEDTMVTTVAAINWPVVDFLTFEQTDQVEIEAGLNPPRLIFGDGIAGNIPPLDAEIRANYFVTSGTNGAVASNTVTSFIGTILAGTTVIGTTISHDEPSTPGSDPESIASIKINAPLVFAAAGRAVTEDDLTGFINSFVDPTFGAVAKGRATAPRSAAEDAEAQSIIASLEAFGVPSTLTQRLNDYVDRIVSSNCEANSIVAQILAADSIGRYVPAPLGLALGLQTFLEDIAESTVAVTVTDGSVNLFSVNLTVEIRLLSTFQSEVAQNAVVDNVRNALQDTLIGRDYGESLRISDLYEIVDTIEGVDFSHITMQVFDNASDDVTSVRVNEFGDLPVESFEVVTMGDTPVVEII